MTFQRLLVVDDDALSREFLTEAARSLGYRVEAVAAPDQAIERLAGRDYDVVLTDLRMPGIDGLELIRRVQAQAPGTATILVTAHGTLETAVEAMRLGASDFLMKPVTPETLSLVLDRVARSRRLAAENQYLRESSFGDAPTLVAKSRSMLDTLESARRIAASKGTVLITGESGTGKERVAWHVHRSSPRRDGPFIRVNCAALSESLLESELFGHERGAFTGAHRRREGRFELADSGTLLLDEIGEISPGLQAKLLRVLEEEEFERVGGTTTLHVDVRIVATTNRDLAAEVATGRFREDLYYRLHVLPLHLAPLRERREDVLPLAEHFARHYSRQGGVAFESFTPAAVARLLAWHWPGNVRELENVVQRAVVLGSGGAIDADRLSFGPTGNGRADQMLRDTPAALPTSGATRASLDELGSLLADRRIEDLERTAILATIASAGGNKTEAARRLGVTSRTLSNKMRLWREQGHVAPKAVKT
jgi:DNA-binding NtrC family response regulator